MKFLLQGDVPDALLNAFMQHIRDFDVAHEGCHFGVTVTTDVLVPVREMVEALAVDPPLPLMEAYELVKRKTQ